MTFLSRRTAIAANGLLAAGLPGQLDGELPALAEAYRQVLPRNERLGE